MSSNLPDPFQHARAHSWPTPEYGTGSGPDFEPVRRNNPLWAVAIIVLFVLVAGFVVFRSLGSDSTTAVTQNQPTPVLTPAAPEATDPALPPEPSVPVEVPVDSVPPVSQTPSDTPVPSPTKTTDEPSPEPSPTRTTRQPLPRPTTPAQLTASLITTSELSAATGQQWGLVFERVGNLESQVLPLAGCGAGGDFGQHVGRILDFKVPGAPVESISHVVDRVMTVARGQGAATVRGYRGVVASCAVRTTATGGQERWSILLDERTSLGERMVIRRVPVPTLPSGADYGTDYLVVRHGDVVNVAELTRGTTAPGLAYSKAVLRALDKAT